MERGMTSTLQIYGSENGRDRRWKEWLSLKILMNSPAVLRNRNDLLQNWFRFRVFRLWNGFCSGSGSGSGSRQQFSKNQKNHKILPFQCQKQIISQKVVLHFSIFYFLLHFMWILIQIRSQTGTGSGTGTGTIMHSGSA